MSEFYEIIPVDTLFFRGSVPMEAGQYNAVSMFPPSQSVLQGAFWTTRCGATGKEYADGLVDGKIPLQVEGFFIKKEYGGKIYYYLPSPATWYYDSDEKKSCGKDLNGKNVVVAEKRNDLFANLGMKSSAGEVVFVVPKCDAQPLSSAWINIEFLQNDKKIFGEDDVLFANEIFSAEQRTGVALTKERKAEDGKLYTSTHIRLREDISIVVQIDKNYGLPDSGKIMLGGEKRMSFYKKIESLSLCNVDDAQNGLFLGKVPVEANECSILENVVASQKIQVTAGWDLQKRFHKPSVNWMPAGAVLNKNIGNVCMPLAKK